MLTACGISTLWLGERGQTDLRLEETRSRPGIIQVFAARGRSSQSDLRGEPPLIVQAETFACFLNPARGTQASRSPSPVVGSVPARPSIHPPVSSMNFRLHGTSCYPSQPGRSMALISEVGGGEGGERWVKEGAEIGHFIIHEIRQDGIVYRDGDRLRRWL